MGPTLFLFFINDLPYEVPSRIEIYADDTPLYSILGKSVFFEKVESAGELESDPLSFVEWGDRWLVAFNATKRKLLSFNRHREPLLVDVEMNDIELTKKDYFTRYMDWKPYSPLPRLLQGKWAPFMVSSISSLLDYLLLIPNKFAFLPTLLEGWREMLIYLLYDNTHE